MGATVRSVEAGSDDAGRTVQRVLHDRLGVSNAEAKGLIAAGCVRRNGRRVDKPDTRVAASDRIELAAEAGRRYAAVAPVRRAGDGYRVLHEDDDLVVVDKEAGVLTVPAGTADGSSLVERLLAAYRKRGHRDPVLRVVHRIDRYTSGLVVFARSHPALLELKRQFKARSPERIYLAVAEGDVTPDRGRYEHDLEEDAKSLKVRVVRGGRRTAQRATLGYRVLERLPRATFVEVALETGRRNQIRVQFAEEGHPLIGDRAYGRPSPLIARVALHAHRLAFTSPRGCRPLRFESPLPGDIRRLLRELRGHTAF
ncbi:MAG TPA: RluA family pseudouridine synthase [Candidatus Sulfotelmatobacter sp.]|jgi:23S rRNA pseudouridine1911/1915/1917 synthase|nr:RluA family pseudouridine synthase [Candidatus Sulfotelmatobacter sp.]